MDVFLTAIYAYGGIGGVVALVFLLFGLDRIDEASHGAYLVRPVLVPGLILLWPIVLVRWIVLERRRGSAR